MNPTKLSTTAIAAIAPLWKKPRSKRARSQKTDTTYEDGIQVGKAIANKFYDVTAVFATADILAIGIMEGAHRNGMIVPNDLSVVGFDNLQICSFASPKLTTISQNVKQKAECSVNLLMRAIDDSSFRRKAVALDVELKELHYIRSENIAQVPDWAKKAIIYQIYPDSFASGKREITRKSKEIRESDDLVSRSKFGGTLRGIAQNIDYLKTLGINCIYLNPIFRANSWHKYDTINYRDIDPCFGTKEDFKALVETCHQNGIRIMIDGVFNHCSPDFFTFRDVLKNGETSRFRDWFYMSGFPVIQEPAPNYECFAYVATMPKLNTGNPEVKRYLIDTALYWTETFHIDAWRLDVANEIDFDFWRSFRKELKAVDSDIFLIGEIWDDARAFLQGDQMDSVMNYNLYYACIDFFALERMTAKEFDERIHYLSIRYKKNIQQVQMNLIDSHDVPRFLTSAAGDIRKLKLAALFLFTYIGIPSIYYGDEKELKGQQEIDYRRPMDWENPEGELFEYYRRLIKLRSENIDAMLGDFETIQADGSLYIYRRKSKMTCITITINNAEASCEVSFAVSTNKGIYTDAVNKHHISVQNGLLI